MLTSKLRGKSGQEEGQSDNKRRQYRNGKQKKKKCFPTKISLFYLE